MRNPRPSGCSAFIAVFLGICLAIVGVISLNMAVNPQPGDPGVTDSAVSAAVCLVLLVVCVTWTVHVSRRISRYQRPRRVPRRRGTVIPAAVFAAIATVVAIVATVNAVQTHSKGELSGFVQTHGIPRNATVASFRVIDHKSGRSISYTTDVTATLSTPVGGASVTTVYVPQLIDYLPGQVVGVLVDPGQPGYSELPGLRYVAAGQWIVAATLAGVMGILAGVFGWAVIASIRLRRAGRELTPLTYQSAKPM
jgi:heme/copper-type cytochrome/quinol oxidase subunit 2